MKKTIFYTQVGETVVNASKNDILRSIISQNYNSMAIAVNEKKLPYVILVTDEIWEKTLSDLTRYNKAARSLREIKLTVFGTHAIYQTIAIVKPAPKEINN